MQLDHCDVVFAHRPDPEVNFHGAGLQAVPC